MADPAREITAAAAENLEDDADELDIDLNYCLEEDGISRDQLYGAPQVPVDVIAQIDYDSLVESGESLDTIESEDRVQRPAPRKTWSSRSGRRAESGSIYPQPEPRVSRPPTTTYSDIIPVEPYYPDEEQLLREGKLGQSDISARVGKVQFGTYQGMPACLLLVKVNFSPKNRNLFRFRNASVMINFAEYQTPHAPISPENQSMSLHGNDGLDSDDEDARPSLKIRTFYPELIRGLVRSGTNNISFGVSAPLSPAGTPTVSGSFGTTRPRDGYHVVQGTLTGPRPQTRVRWTITENEISKSGIYEQPRLAVIVQHAPGTKFTMSLDLKATTLAGLAVKGKGGATLKLDPTRKAVAVGGREWDTTSPSPNKNPPTTPPPAYEPTKPTIGNLLDLGTVDLERLTGMAAALLGASGPGAMQSGGAPLAPQAPAVPGGESGGDNSNSGISFTVPV